MPPILTQEAVVMRKPDNVGDGFQLLYENGKPPTALNGARVHIWVYWQKPQQLEKIASFGLVGETLPKLIREIVITGHTASRICASATALLMEAMAKLPGDVERYIVCGAGYIKVADHHCTSHYTNLLSKNGPSPIDIVKDLINDLQRLAQSSGLIEVHNLDWNHLEKYRKSYESKRKQSRELILLPECKDESRVVFLQPLIPNSHSTDEPFTVKLNGWDFDCPEFQVASTRHLQNVRRELLRDALRRREIYGSWLQEWCIGSQGLVRLVKLLPENELEGVRIELPTSSENTKTNLESNISLGQFLKNHVSQFATQGTSWQSHALYMFVNEPHSPLNDAELDAIEVISAGNMTIVDFEGGVRRQAERNEVYEETKRQRIKEIMPNLISHCLRYIQQMDDIIEPYNNPDNWDKEHTDKPEHELTATQLKTKRFSMISRSIAMESMVRGWPSIFMSDKADRKIFDSWAKKYRKHIWRIINEEAQKRNIRIEQLLEDNVVYKVTYDDDLGSTLHPLILIDNTYQVQIHGSKAKMSLNLPLWTNTAPQYLIPPPASKSNSYMADLLISKAIAISSKENCDKNVLASLLRQALGYHPVVGGQLIIQEWALRLGKDTSNEFNCAKNLINAFELCGHYRYDEAFPHLQQYFKAEQKPLPSAYVAAALCETEYSGKSFAELLKQETICRQINEIIKKHIPQEYEDIDQQLLQEIHRGRHPRLLQALIERKKAYSEKERIEKEIQNDLAKVRNLFASALENPDAYQASHPYLAKSITLYPELIEKILSTENKFNLFTYSSDYVQRYFKTSKLIEASDLLATLLILSKTYNLLDNCDARNAENIANDLRKAARAIWLGAEQRLQIEDITQSLLEGKKDRIHLSSLGTRLETCMGQLAGNISELMQQQYLWSPDFAEELYAKIYLTQVFYGHYMTAFEQMISAEVTLSRMKGVEWSILDHQISIPESGYSLGFDSDNGVIFINEKNQTKKILSLVSVNEKSLIRLQTLFSTDDLPTKINPMAPTLAEAILTLTIEPDHEYQQWCEGMKLIKDELILAMGMYEQFVSVIPEKIENSSKQGQEHMQQLEKQAPIDSPVIDYLWKNRLHWSEII
jgi:hypothetical protein